MTDTPHQNEWEQKSVEELGGKLHPILNKTVDGRLTVAEYSKVVKLISVMLCQTQADAYNKGFDAGRGEVLKPFLENLARTQPDLVKAAVENVLQAKLTS